ncbi:hypothetical protein [Nocardia asteroides]|uniref:hypothetical protein n=1 Tax=Nocardia asteroides TaxID=1824 RepID=UPI001E58DD9B|nr:hypothetical protein [Nocardia asteroides]UGT61854.1 hypothetical protein LTT61_00400 [Nocardia asteroides]
MSRQPSWSDSGREVPPSESAPRARGHAGSRGHVRLEVKAGRFIGEIGACAPVRTRGRATELGVDLLLRAGARESAAVEARTPAFALASAMPSSPLDRALWAVTSLDSRGRLGNRALVRALGWTPREPITMVVRERLLVIRGARRARLSIRHDGFIRIPAGLRRACGLHARHQVLLAADPGTDTLVVYPARLLGEALWRYRPEVWARTLTSADGAGHGQGR